MKQVLVFHMKPGNQQSPQFQDGNGNWVIATTIPGAPWLAVLTVDVHVSFTAEEP